LRANLDDFNHFTLFCISQYYFASERGCMATKKDLVRELRLNKRLTQADVAAKMRISQGSYSAIERGQKPRAVEEALTTINRMRTRTDRTDGGAEKTGRLKD